MRTIALLGLLLFVGPRPLHARCARGMLAPALVAPRAPLGPGAGVLVTMEAVRYRSTVDLSVVEEPFPRTLALRTGDTTIALTPRALAANLRLYVPAAPVPPGRYEVLRTDARTLPLQPSSEARLEFVARRFSAPASSPVIMEATAVPAMGRAGVPHLRVLLDAPVPRGVRAMIVASRAGTIAALVDAGDAEVVFQNGGRCGPGAPDYVLPEAGSIRAWFVGAGGGQGPVASATVSALDPTLP